MEYIYFFLIFVNVQSKQKERQQLTPDSDRSNSRKVIDSWRNDANIIKFINVLSSGFLNLEQQSILGVELMLATSLEPIVMWCAYRNPNGWGLGPGLGIKWLVLWQVSELCQSGSQVLLTKVSAEVEMRGVCVCVQGEH